MSSNSARPLGGCVIVVSGKHENWPHKKISTYIKKIGGTPASTVNKQATHLIAASSKSTAKFIAASENNISKVNLNWLLDSGKAGKKMAEKNYPVGKENTRASLLEGSLEQNAVKNERGRKTMINRNSRANSSEHTSTSGDNKAKKKKNKGTRRDDEVVVLEVDINRDESASSDENFNGHNTDSDASIKRSGLSRRRAIAIKKGSPYNHGSETKLSPSSRNSRTLTVRERSPANRRSTDNSKLTRSSGRSKP